MHHDVIVILAFSEATQKIRDVKGCSAELRKSSELVEISYVPRAEQEVS